MGSFEYASYWIWDTRDAGEQCFRNLRALTKTGWEVVGEFLKLPEVDEHAGLWVLRRPRSSIKK